MELGTVERSKLKLNKGERLYTTRSSEGFQASAANSDSEPLVLWIHRHPMTADSDILFRDRMELIGSTKLPIANVVAFGIDDRGHGWVATDDTSGSSLLGHGATIEDMEPQFVRAVQIVAALHNKDIVLGDICEDSFIVNPSGEVSLQGFIGGFDANVDKTAMLPPRETLHFLAPEQRTGGLSEKTSDVFALGILGYRIFAGSYPAGAESLDGALDNITSRVPAPSVVNPSCPGWLDDVLGTSLENLQTSRYSDAGEMVEVIKAALVSGEAPGGAGRWSKKTVMVNLANERELDSSEQADNADGKAPVKERSLIKRPLGEHTLKSKQINNELVKEANRPPPAPDTEQDYYESSNSSSLGLGKIFLALLGLGLFGIIGAIGYQFFTGDVVSEIGQKLDINEEIAPPELKPSLNDLKSSSVSLEVKKDALKRIAESDSPIAYNVLVSVIKNSGKSPLGVSAREHIINNLTKRGWRRSAELINNWFEGMDQANIDPSRSGNLLAILQVADDSITTEARQAKLRTLFEVNPSLGLQYAAALGLDTKGDQKFTPLLRAFLKQRYGHTDLEDKSIYAMILSEESLLAQFEGDIKDFLGELTENDLAWGMLFLARQNSLALEDVAKEILSRDVVPSFQKLFVKILNEVDHFSLPKNVKMALVRSARGETKMEDINVLGRWYDQRAETALMAICAMSDDKKLRKHAFSTLGGRTLSKEPGRSLVAWVKRNYWEYRVKLARPVAILSLKSVATDEQLEFAFDNLAPYFSGGGIFKMFEEIGDSQLILLALTRVGGALPDDVLTELLVNEKKEIRSLAVQALKGRNALHVLQAITKAYQQEKDPEVIKLYEEMHWVTRDRSRSLGEE